MRPAIYARSSTDMQSLQSAEDQIRQCKAHTARQGWDVGLVRRDEVARAGAMAYREGYQSLVSAARNAGFEVLPLAELPTPIGLLP